MSSNFDLNLAIAQACDQAQDFFDQLREDKPRDGDERMSDVRLLDTFLRQIPIPPLPERPLGAMPLQGLGLGIAQTGFDLDLAIAQACDQAQQFLDQLRKNKLGDGDKRMSDVRLLDTFLRQIPIPPLPERPLGAMPLQGLRLGIAQPRPVVETEQPPEDLDDFRSVLQALKPLLKFIYSGEGNYDSYNRGRAGDSPGGWPGGLQKLTIAEVMQLQTQLGVHAVGAAQFIPTTLPIALKESRLTVNDLFNAENQDRLAIALLLGNKRPKLAAYLKGKSDDLDAAQIELAQEWASVPKPDGRGVHDDDSAGNRATKTIAEVRKALQAARNALLKVPMNDDGHGTGEPVKKPPIKEFIQSPNFSSRNGADINTVVVHHTNTRSVNSVISHFRNRSSEVSAHYTIDQNGDIYQMVDDAQKAWHARRANAHSIGIEHVAALGDRLTDAQERSSVQLIKWLMAEYKIPTGNIKAHMEVVATKCPGTIFGDAIDDTGLPKFRAWVAKHFERPMTLGDDTDRVGEDTRNSIYIVKPGDTFSRIAIIHSMSEDELKALNSNIANFNIIFPGQIIIVSASSNGVVSNDGTVGFDFKIAEEFISLAAGTHQFFSNPILGNGRISGGFMEDSGHSPKGPRKAIFLDGSLRPLPPADRNIGIDYVIDDFQVKAWYSGTVTERGLEKGYGNRVHILLDIEFDFEGDSYAVYQAYAHLRSISVSRGEKINQGQKIGVMGNSSTRTRGGKLILVQDAPNMGAHVDLDTYISKGGDHISINPQLIEKQLGWTI